MKKFKKYLHIWMVNDAKLVPSAVVQTQMYKFA